MIIRRDLTMRHTISKALFSALMVTTLWLGGCADDNDLQRNDIGSTVESSSGARISTFTISNTTMMVPDSLREVTVVLLPEEGGESMSFAAETSAARETVRCTMTIPKGRSIPDGKYLLMFETPDGMPLGARIRVRFKGEMLNEVGDVNVVYMGLRGSGTVADPYLIGCTEDFETLVSNLRRDSVEYGAGLCFLQTATFQAPVQSRLIDGRGYYGRPFAGTYDGGGNAITGLYYIGADSGSEPGKDSGIGLFSSLREGAHISNLEISGATIINGYDEIGLLAGSAEGDVSVTRVSVSGSIVNSHDLCGGLIGRHLGGSLLLTQIDMGVNINGNDRIGGIVGNAEGDIYINDITTSSHQFSVKGNNCVGGVFGYISGLISLESVSLNHTVSEEDSRVVIVSGNDNVGGIAGHAIISKGGSDFYNISVKCPVGGTNYVGGLFGSLEASAPARAKGCLFSSIVTGRDYVGGFAGSVKSPGKHLAFKGTDNESRVVVTKADAEVKGSSHVGGFSGRLEGEVAFDAKFEIAVNVTGTSDYVGGFAGIISGGTLQADRISMTSNTMIVDGEDYVGGYAGKIESSVIKGSDAFDYTEKWIIPSESSRHSLFNGNVRANRYAGGIAGGMENSSVKGVHCAATITASEYGGGIVGEATCNSSYIIEDSTFGGDLKISGSYTGGIAGTISDGIKLRDCVNYASFSCNDNTGGIVGFADYTNAATDIDYCVNLGAISGASCVGGIVGYMYGRDHYTQVYKCGNYGAVTGSRKFTGGIVGSCDGKRIRVWNCANHGNVHTSSSDGAIGGIAGHLGEDPSGVFVNNNLEVRECYNGGEMTSSQSGVFIGGILGYQEEGEDDTSDHDSWVHDCLNEGPIPSDTKDDTGGIVGCVDHYSIVERCYNRGKVSHGNAMIGTRKSAAIVKCYDLYALTDSGKGWHCNGFFEKGTSEKSYRNFDFSRVWIMTDGYPRLRDCPFQDARP